MINFIFPFGIIVFNYLKSGIYNIFVLMAVLRNVYNAIPIHHVAVRIILPLIFTSFYLAKQR